ncbi:hypothetical protein [Bacillus thuringiensis]|uniref:hypothetical protein n=1 Tax=Bacillus thuringiensis TaxID=1428 RepID=UPI002D7F11B7|nr:hypothetical protein [Bacillus thuringiensis]MEB4819769.1 hypothetical protein [Bacillus thuringiensis]
MMKVARTVLSGGKDGDNFKVLPIATIRKGEWTVNLKEYVVYKGESLLCIGTIQECADCMDVLPAKVRFYTRTAYQRIIANRKNRSL